MKNIILLTLLSLLLILLTCYIFIPLYKKNYEGLTNVDDLSGQWNGPLLAQGPITFIQNGNIINSVYPGIGQVVGIIENNSIAWKVISTGLVTLGTILKNADGQVSAIRWNNGFTWLRQIPQKPKPDTNVPTTPVPNMSGDWFGDGMTAGPMTFTQKDNVVITKYPELGVAEGIITNNKIVWVWNNDTSKKIVGDIILKDNNVESIKWSNGIVWNKLKPAINIAGLWNGPGLNSGPLNIIQKGHTLSSVYPGYGVLVGNIINNLISITWVTSKVSVSGSIVKDSKGNVNQIKWDNNIIWNKVKPPVNIAGQWNGFGLDSGPITIIQKDNVISSVYPVYGQLLGEIVDHSVGIKWLTNGLTAEGNVVKDKNGNLNIIKFTNGVVWNKVDNTSKSPTQNPSTQDNKTDNSNLPTKKSIVTKQIQKQNIKPNTFATPLPPADIKLNTPIDPSFDQSSLIQKPSQSNAIKNVPGSVAPVQPTATKEQQAAADNAVQAWRNAKSHLDFINQSILVNNQRGAWLIAINIQKTQLPAAVQEEANTRIIMCKLCAVPGVKCPDDALKVCPKPAPTPAPAPAPTGKCVPNVPALAVLGNPVLDGIAGNGCKNFKSKETCGPIGTMCPACCVWQPL